MAERFTELFGSLNLTESAAATQKLRIASWNVNGLTTKSEARCEIIKDVAEAIKYYKFDIVAFQEISSDDALQRLCRVLNQDKTLWLCASQESTPHNSLKLGFVWKSTTIQYEYVQNLPFEYFERTPYNLKFKFEDVTITLVNLHLISRGNDKPTRIVEISKKLKMTKNKIS